MKIFKHGRWYQVFSTTLLIKSARSFSSSPSVLKKKCNNTDDEEFASSLQTINYVFDLRNPGKVYNAARSIKRDVIFHAGPTNSGKTHHALEAFLSADTAIYYGPLRMLAGEIYGKSNARNVPCDMITGEEKRWAVSSDEPSNHTASTVELCNISKQFDVAVIDEVQMLRDFERGWAWTRALLGVPAKQLHLCGEPSAIDIVKKLLSKTDDTLQVRMYDRLTPLKVLEKSVRFKKLKAGDCVVSFSQRTIYTLRSHIERLTTLKCAVVYGNLPPNVRFEQAEKFNSGECDILIASDAIGMGLNLNINRIIFAAVEKFDGYNHKELTPYHTKQIAGRAGRYKSKYETGFVTTLADETLPTIKKLMHEPIDDITQAGIFLTENQLEILSFALPQKDVVRLLEIFELWLKLDENCFLCDVEEMKRVCKLLEDIPLTISETYQFAIAPVKDTPVVSYMLKQFALHVHEKTVVSDRVVKKLLNWPPSTNPRKLFELQHLEHIHEVFDLYRWLSYRFEEIFVHRDRIIHLQEELEHDISGAVDRNLKQNRKKKNSSDQFL